MTDNPHEYRQHYLNEKRTEIAYKAVKMFTEGYTLKTITKRLTEHYRPFTAFDRYQIQDICFSSIMDFVKRENRGEC